MRRDEVPSKYTYFSVSQLPQSRRHMASKIHRTAARMHNSHIYMIVAMSVRMSVNFEEVPILSGISANSNSSRPLVPRCIRRRDTGPN